MSDKQFELIRVNDNSGSIEYRELFDTLDDAKAACLAAEGWVMDYHGEPVWETDPDPIHPDVGEFVVYLPSVYYTWFIRHAVQE